MKRLVFVIICVLSFQNAYSQNNITINSSFIINPMSGNLTNNSIMIIGNEYYIRISTVRYLINGVLQEDEKA